MVQALGPALDITKLYPQRELFHISELKNYYLAVALYQARIGDPMLACGLVAAMKVIDPEGDGSRHIERELLVRSTRQLGERMQMEREKRIAVTMQPLPKKITEHGQPTFQHEEIHAVYAHSMALPLSAITEILALPRETLIADLIHVLDTEFIALLVWNCIDLRAIRPLPLITQAWEKGCIEEFITGNLDSISDDIVSPTGHLLDRQTIQILSTQILTARLGSDKIDRRRP